MIPKIIHVIWIGDESKRPDNCIQTWVEKNPSFYVHVWGNQAFASKKWINAHHMREMFGKELNGVADMMRYEILNTVGGLTIDADSFCVRGLEDWMLEPNEIICWENEIVRPGLLGCNLMGSVKGSTFFKAAVDFIQQKETVIDGAAWQTVGPKAITEVWNKTQHPITIYPSHFVCPNHFDAPEYLNGGQVFCKQFWGSTFNSYDNIHQKELI